MKLFCIFLLDFLASEVFGFIVEFFATRSVVMVTSALCAQETNIRLHKEFSEKKILFGCLNVGRFNETEIVKSISSKFVKLGVLLDLKCPRTMDLLKTADKNDLFTFSNSLTVWLILTRNHISKENLELLTEIHAPNLSDPIRFLTQPYEIRNNEKYLLEINKQINSDFIKSYKKPRRRIPKGNDYLANATDLHEILKMNILLDNEMTLAVPESSRKNDYALFEIYKTTVESKTRVVDEGKVTEKGLQLKTRKRRRDFGNDILKAASAIFQPEAFTTIDDLATKEFDIWAKMSYPHVKLLAEDLNFRIIIRFYDDYGWQKNGTFGHLMGLLQQKKADISAGALLLREDRFGIVSFLECPFRLQTGILFREPSLSSVSNVFLLPFSKAIWISIGVTVVLTMIALRCRIAAGKKLLPPDPNVNDFFDIVNYVVGAVCQQGFSATPKSLSARVTILIILLTSLALFTSYSASIVALLQSPSTAISTIEDLTRSNLEVGIQANFPFYIVLMQEAVHPVLKEFYKRKVLVKGDKAFCSRREGIERMRTGMFAFEVEVSAGYKLIKETYEEREKCGIKEIDPIPKPFICMAVQESSPFKEIFRERFIWQLEAGFFERSWDLWVDQRPKCEVGRIGFISVGLVEFRPALMVFVYGLVATAFVFVFEILNKKTNKYKSEYKSRKLFLRRTGPKLSFVKH